MQESGNRDQIIPNGVNNLSLNQVQHQVFKYSTKNVSASTWRDRCNCLKWLNVTAGRSVIYVDFGCAVMFDREKIIEIERLMADRVQDLFGAIKPYIANGKMFVVKKIWNS